MHSVQPLRLPAPKAQPCAAVRVARDKCLQVADGEAHFASGLGRGREVARAHQAAHAISGEIEKRRRLVEPDEPLIGGEFAREQAGLETEHEEGSE